MVHHARLVIVAVSLALGLIAGCGGSSNGSASTAKPDPIMLRLTGTHEMDLEYFHNQLIAVAQAQGAPPDAISKIRGNLNSQLADSYMLITLAENGTASGRSKLPDEPSKAMTGTWSVNGDRITIELNAPGEDQGPASGVISGDSFILDTFPGMGEVPPGMPKPELRFHKSD